jgi:hypothetical protein
VRIILHDCQLSLATPKWGGSIGILGNWAITLFGNQWVITCSKLLPTRFHDAEFRESVKGSAFNNGNLEI